MSPKKLTTFRELVEAEYFAKGKTATDLKRRLGDQYRVNERAVDNALAGTRVQPETALRLALWAEREHGVTLDKDALIFAPSRRQARDKGAA